MSDPPDIYVSEKDLKILGRVVGFSPQRVWPDSDALIDLHEKALVQNILTNGHLHTFFNFVVENSLGWRRRGWEYIFLAEISREDLGLERGLQPGDIDVIIMPHKDGWLHLDKVTAIEVKRLAIKSGRIGKNTDRYGITQAHGLLRDGFPYVGILHVIVAEPGLESDHRQLNQAFLTGVDDRIEDMGPHPTDATGLRAAQMQVARLLRHHSESVVGINAVGIQLRPSNGRSVTIFPQQERLAKPNPRPSANLEKRLAGLAYEVAAQLGLRTD